MTDRLRMDYINGLSQPFLVRFCGDRYTWPVYDIEVQTSLVRIDACGKLEPKSFAEVAEIWDGDGNKHDPEDWYTPPTE
jgi:hypothetical protein